MAARSHLLLVALIFLLLAWQKPAPAWADHDVHFWEALARANLDPVWSPDSRRIAYVSFDTKESEFPLVLAMGPDGNQQQKMTTGVFAVWAPDGRSVAVVRPENPWSIWIARSNGGGEFRLVPWRVHDSGIIFKTWSVFGRPFSWSPDSSQIAFDDILKGILVINANGGSPKILVSDEDAFCPAWSPDGQHVVFTHAKESSPPQVHVINVDGSGLRSLTSQRAGWAPTWSPDGKRIAFVSGPAFGSGLEIYVMNANGSGQTKLATRGDIIIPEWEKLSFFFGHWPGLAWSPDGGHLAFHAMYTDPDGKKSMQIFLVGTDGTGLRRLTSGRHYWAPVWSSDGRVIVFNGMDTTAKPPEGEVPIHVYAIRSEGGDLVRLTGRK